MQINYKLDVFYPLNINQKNITRSEIFSNLSFTDFHYILELENLEEIFEIQTKQQPLNKQLLFLIALINCLYENQSIINIFLAEHKLKGWTLASLILFCLFLIEELLGKNRTLKEQEPSLEEGRIFCASARFKVFNCLFALSITPRELENNIHQAII